MCMIQVVSVWATGGNHIVSGKSILVDTAGARFTNLNEVFCAGSPAQKHILTYNRLEVD